MTNRRFFLIASRLGRTGWCDCATSSWPERVSRRRGAQSWKHIDRPRLRGRRSRTLRESSCERRAAYVTCCSNLARIPRVAADDVAGSGGCLRCVAHRSRPAEQRGPVLRRETDSFAGDHYNNTHGGRGARPRRRSQLPPDCGGRHGRSRRWRGGQPHGRQLVGPPRAAAARLDLPVGQRPCAGNRAAGPSARAANWFDAGPAGRAGSGAGRDGDDVHGGPEPGPRSDDRPRWRFTRVSLPGRPSAPADEGPHLRADDGREGWSWRRGGGSLAPAPHPDQRHLAGPANGSMWTSTCCDSRTATGCCSAATGSPISSTTRRLPRCCRRDRCRETPARSWCNSRSSAAGVTTSPPSSPPIPFQITKRPVDNLRVVGLVGRDRLPFDSISNC